MNTILTATEAAKAVGKSRPTIMRMIKAGQLSATRDTHGIWRIDTAELYRVFPGEHPLTPPEHLSTSLSTGAHVDMLARVQRAEQDAALAREDARRWQEQAQAWQAMAERLSRGLPAGTMPEPRPSWLARIFKRF